MASTDCPEAEVSGEIVVILTFEVSQIKTNEWGGGRIGRDKVVYRGFFVDQPNAPRRTKRTRPFQPPPPDPDPDSRCPRYIHSRLLCMQD